MKYIGGVKIIQGPGENSALIGTPAFVEMDLQYYLWKNQYVFLNN